METFFKKERERAHYLYRGNTSHCSASKPSSTWFLLYQGLLPGWEVSSSSISHSGQPLNSQELPQLGIDKCPCTSTPYTHKCPLNWEEAGQGSGKEQVWFVRRVLNWSPGAFPISCVTLKRIHLISCFPQTFLLCRYQHLPQTGLRGLTRYWACSAYLEHSSCSTKDSSAMLSPVKLGQVLDAVAVSAASVRLSMPTLRGL